MISSSRRGTSLLELAIAMLILGLVGTFFIPALLKAREKSRRTRCQQNLHKIIRGVNRYENTNQCYPPGRLRPDWEVNGRPINASNYSGVQQNEETRTGFYTVHIWILPFVRAQDIFDLIDFDRGQAQLMERSGVPFNINYEAYTKPMPLYLCPSDPNTGRGITENNYRYNFGGATPGAGKRSINGLEFNPRPTDLWHPGGNGAFTIGEKGLEAKDFVDGLTKTVFFSERTKGGGQPFNSVPTKKLDMIRCPSGRILSPNVDFEFAKQDSEDYVPGPNGSFTFTSAGRWPENCDFSHGWPFASYTSTEYNHVAPPNWKGIDCGVSFISNTPGEHAIVAARSEHPRSVNVAFGDGHVKSVSDDIDLTVWRALGTRNGGEAVNDYGRKREKRRRRLW